MEGNAGPTPLASRYEHAANTPLTSRYEPQGRNPGLSSWARDAMWLTLVGGMVALLFVTLFMLFYEILARREPDQRLIAIFYTIFVGLVSLFAKSPADK
jgi:multisubunit Na+/H+ antiporter MnhB subunit